MARGSAPVAERARVWLSTLPAMLLLVVVIGHGAADKIHVRLLQGGESLWPGYAELRTDPTPPQCDPEAPAAAAECRKQHETYVQITARITDSVRAYRSIEMAVASAVQLGVEYLRHLLVAMLLLCAVTAAALRHHIALGPVRTRPDDRVSEAVQLLANLALLASSYAKYTLDQESGLDLQHPSLPVLWMVGFAALAAVNAYHLARPRGDPSATLSLKAGLAVPLYASMAVIAAVYFFFIEAHPAGPAIYLEKLTEHSLLYIHVGLYVWAGMLLKRTRLAPLCFDVVRPLRLPPELLAFVVVAAAAIPTAYSGASGIFVIAAGTMIYDELRRAGARTHLALAATAMSGSLGVVLRPCLLVVVVTSMNEQVSTDQLFAWGWRVFGLTSVLFLVASLINRREEFQVSFDGDALRDVGRGLGQLVPYAAILVALVMLTWLGLDTQVDEHTAPTLLPLFLFVLLAYDRRAGRRGVSALTAAATGSTGFRRGVFEATHETTVHIGALLMLMAMSVGVGGMVERSDVMSALPASFGSPIAAMAILVSILVVIGMVMDPYGAVILVSTAMAPVAYANDIDPVHFWMVVLVAFELAYLTPPLALNHLLTRQVVGLDLDELARETEGASFWRRHERVLLPIAVLSVALLVVAFGPLLQ